MCWICFCLFSIYMSPILRLRNHYEEIYIVFVHDKLLFSHNFFTSQYKRTNKYNYFSSFHIRNTRWPCDIYIEAVQWFSVTKTQKHFSNKQKPENKRQRGMWSWQCHLRALIRPENHYTARAHNTKTTTVKIQHTKYLEVRQDDNFFFPHTTKCTIHSHVIIWRQTDLKRAQMEMEMRKFNTIYSQPQTNEIIKIILSLFRFRRVDEIYRFAREHANSQTNKQQTLDISVRMKCAFRVEPIFIAEYDWFYVVKF